MEDQYFRMYLLVLQLPRNKFVCLFLSVGKMSVGVDPLLILTLFEGWRVSQIHLFKGGSHLTQNAGSHFVERN